MKIVIIGKKLWVNEVMVEEGGEGRGEMEGGRRKGEVGRGKLEGGSWKEEGGRRKLEGRELIN